MAGRTRGGNPRSLAHGRDRFAAWRQTRESGARIPDTLWSLAVKLANAHSLSRTASALKLDYNALKNRVEAKNADGPSSSGAFIELSPASPSASGECMIEFEDGSGASMRVHLRGCDAPDLVALGRSFWNGQ